VRPVLFDLSRAWPEAGGVNRRAINAWCMYDWANSAFVTTVTAALFPPFFRGLVLAGGRSGSEATAYWGYTSSVALLVVAAVAPLLGATADHTGGKKRYVACLAGIGILATGSFVLIGEGAWLAASALYVVAALGFAGGNVFYDSFLPQIARGADIDRVSSRGFAMGYLGGGVLLVVNVLWVRWPHVFGMPSAEFAVRASFVSVALWWALFSIPFFRHVPEPETERRPGAFRNPVAEGFHRLTATFRDIRRYRQLMLFLVAYWVYTDGVGTIVRMATAYGDEIGVGLNDMITALVITQAVGIPSTLLFGRLARRVGAKRSILLALGVYAIVSVSAYFMRTAAHFYALAFAVATVQGGSQALSRSLFGRMVPAGKSAEFFGFYSTSSKFAGVFGPFVFGLVGHLMGHSRAAIASLVAFFVVGGILLTRVDIEEGIRAAQR